MIFRSFASLSVLFCLLCTVGVPRAQRAETRQVTFLTDDTLSLQGTLRIPNSSGRDKRSPCVIFVHGSGPQTRDEAVMVLRFDTTFRRYHYDWSRFHVKGVNLDVGRANILMGLLRKDTLAPDDGEKYATYKDTVFLFRDLAAHLAQEGIASFAYDKRSYTYGKVLIAKGSRPAPAALGGIDDYVRDVESALRFVRTIPTIDPTRIVLVAHSQGASGIAQLVALKHPDAICGLVLLAGSTEPIERTIHDQLVGTRTGALVDTLLHDIRIGVPNYQLLWALNASGSYWKSWMRMTDSVIPYCQRLSQPVLVMQGTLDLNVNVSEAFTLDSLLQQRQGGRTTLAIYPGLDHMFRLPWDLSVDPRVSEKLSEWIKRVAKSSVRRSH